MCSHKNGSKKRLLNLDKLLKIGVDISQDMTTDVVSILCINYNIVYQIRYLPYNLVLA